MSSVRFDRRALLKAMGAGLALLPMLESELARAAPMGSGSSYPGPRRFIVLTQVNGCIAEQFYPTGTGTDLTQLSLPQSTSVLAPHVADLVMFNNLSWYGASDATQLAGVDTSHGAFDQMLGGGNNKIVYNVDPSGFGDASPNGPSIDQYIAQAFRAQNVSTMLPSLSMSTGCGQDAGFGNRCFWAGAGQSISPLQDPGVIFDTIFAGGAGTSSDGGLSSQAALLRSQQKSILDMVGGQLTTFSRNLGKGDQIRIQAHMQAVRDLESRLTAPSTTSTVACTKPGRPAMGASSGYVNKDGWERIADLVQLAVLAVQCDVTRVVGIQLMDMNGKPMYMPTPIPSTQSAYSSSSAEFDEYHAIAHAAGSPKVQCDRFFLSFLGSLLDQLKAVSEGGATLLDHTMVLWANSFGDGGAHTGPPLPWILAGGSGLGVKTGTLVSGGLVTQVMQTILAGMGLSANTFGDPHGTRTGFSQLLT